MKIIKENCRLKRLKGNLLRALGAAIAVLLISLLLFSCSSSGSGSQGEGNASEKPKSSMKPESGGKAQESGGEESNGEEKKQDQSHEYISEAKRVTIDIIDAAKLDVSHVVFLDTNRISVTCPTDIGEQRSLIYDLEKEQAVKLPDNIEVIKKLEDEDLYAKPSNNSGYIILDGTSFNVKKVIDPPENIDPVIDISPDGTLLSYVTDEGLFVSDLNFQNEVLLVIASKKNSIFDSKVARYPRWLDSGRIAYKTVSLEGVESCGVVSRDGTSNKVFAETKDATVYPLISGDFLARYDNGKGIALIDTNTDGKQYLTEALLESEGFSYDKNGKWVSYFRLNKEKSKKKEKSGSEGENGSSSGNSGGSSSGNSSGSGGSSGGSGGGEDSKKSEWTAKFEIVGITSDSTLYEFETDKQSVRPIKDAVASPDGKILLFTDIDKTGRRVLYKLDIDSESVKAEEGKGEESS